MSRNGPTSTAANNEFPHGEPKAGARAAIPEGTVCYYLSKAVFFVFINHHLRRDLESMTENGKPPANSK